jgi:hypothetical protein
MILKGPPKILRKKLSKKRRKRFDFVFLFYPKSFGYKREKKIIFQNSEIFLLINLSM